MRKISIIGLDIAKSVFQVHGDDSAGNPVLTRRLKRREVLAFFKKLERCVVALEACGAAHYWAREIAALRHTVRLVPPAFVKRFLTGRRKTDPRDARALALAGASLELRAVPVKSKEQQAELCLMGVRRLLIQQRTQAANSLRGRLAEMGLVARTGDAGLDELIAKVETGQAELPAVLTQAIAALVHTLRHLEAEIAKLTSQLGVQVRTNPDTKRLTTAPGVGPIIAFGWALKVPDASRFKSGRDCAAWLGLAPNEHSSANKRRLGHITKAGDEDLRSLLVQGGASLATVAKRNPAKAHPWVVAIVKRRPFKVAIVAIAARLARTLWAMQRDRSSFRPWTSEKRAKAAA